MTPEQKPDTRASVSQQQDNLLFQRLFHIPLADAIELSKLDTPQGHQWKSVLESINGLSPEELIEKNNLDLDA